MVVFEAHQQTFCSFHLLLFKITAIHIKTTLEYSRYKTHFKIILLSEWNVVGIVKKTKQNKAKQQECN